MLKLLYSKHESLQNTSLQHYNILQYIEIKKVCRETCGPFLALCQKTLVVLPLLSVLLKVVLIIQL